MSENFPQTDVRHQTTDWRISENTKQDKCPRNLFMHIIFKGWKIKNKEKFLKAAQGKKHLTFRRTKLSIISNFSEITQASREIFSVGKN